MLKTYIHSIRPGLEYGCVLYDSCSKQLKDKLEDTQRRAAIACTRAFNRTPTIAVLKELRWPTMEKRRQYMRMLYMFKMKNQLTPRYLSDILFPQQGHYSEYSTRHRNNFIIPRTRTTKYHESFIPKSSREWNSMPEEIKSCECLATFKRLVKKKLFPTKTEQRQRKTLYKSCQDENGLKSSKFLWNYWLALLWTLHWSDGNYNPLSANMP